MTDMKKRCLNKSPSNVTVQLNRSCGGFFFSSSLIFLNPEKAQDTHAIVVKIPWKPHAAARCLSDRQLKWPRNDISPLANIIKVYYLSGRSTVNKCPSKVRLKDREGADNEIQGWQMALSLTLWHLTERDIQRVWNFCLCCARCCFIPAFP